MSRAVVSLLMAALLATTLLSQSKEEKEQQKEYEKQVDKAIADFQKAFNSGTEAQKADAIDILKSINPPHDKMFAELAKCVNGAPLIRKKAIEFLATIDHPQAAQQLAAAVKPSLTDKPTLENLVKALDKVKWDVFCKEMADQLIAEKCFDKDLSPVAYNAIVAAERIGCISFVDGLIKCLKKIDDQAKQPGATSNDQYRQQVIKALKSCTGEEKTDAKTYETWWKQAQQQLVTKMRIIMWCKATGKRWDKKAGDEKAYCPHHEDKKAAGKDPVVIAMVSLK